MSAELLPGGAVHSAEQRKGSCTNEPKRIQGGRFIFNPSDCPGSKQNNNKKKPNSMTFNLDLFV